MQSVLITGAHGFLGRYTALRFKMNGYHVIGMGLGSWENEKPSDFGIDDWRESDITLEALSVISREIEGIVHCAGSGSVAFSFENPGMDFSQNVQTELAALEFIRLSGSPMKFIYPSSAAVYGLQDDRELYVTDVPHPVSPYGYHKLIAEHLCESYAANFKVHASVIRFFSIYGEGLRKLLLWDACRKFDGPGDTLMFFGTGNETRDWIHASDAAGLIFTIFQKSEGYSLYNGGSGTRHSIMDVITLCGKALKSDKKVVFNGVQKQGDPKHYWADMSPARSIGWENTVSFGDGLERYISWFREKA